MRRIFPDFLVKKAEIPAADDDVKMSLPNGPETTRRRAARRLLFRFDKNFQLARADGLHQDFVILFALVGVGDREVGDGRRRRPSSRTARRARSFGKTTRSPRIDPNCLEPPAEHEADGRECHFRLVNDAARWVLVDPPVPPDVQ
jgi:hypothetical protein